jgi:hypothetical protein
MTQKRDKKRAQDKAEWTQESQRQIAKARAEFGLEPDELIPDEVLVMEVAHFLPRSNPTGSRHHDIASCEQWAKYRLIGIADTHEGRVRLAKSLSNRYSVNPNRSGNGSSVRRRSAESGRRRNIERRT